MSGYVERKYVFEGGTIPGKFFEDAYSPSWEAKHLRVVEVRVTNYGDDSEVVISAECEETIDWFMQDWSEKEKK